MSGDTSAILLKKLFYFAFWGRDNLPSHPNRFWSEVVSLRVYYMFVLKFLIDCLTWITVNPISKSPCYDAPRQFYQVWKISQHTQGFFNLLYNTNFILEK
jgi:hypothetical protein